MKFVIDSTPLSLAQVLDLHREGAATLELSAAVLRDAGRSHENFQRWLDRRVPIYGVTTGFGDSCDRAVRPEDAEVLQDNLISYLLAGTGPLLSEEVGRSVLFFRLVSLSRGYSGVSVALLHKMVELYNLGISPAIPREGSLGASGDLIPLAYLADNLRGHGQAYHRGALVQVEELVARGVFQPHKLAPKEGLALVNGTTCMVALCFHNYRQALRLTELATLGSAWLCLSIRGRKEAFGPLVNEVAKSFAGQALVARRITALLDEEGYQALAYEEIAQDGEFTSHLVQDRYSLRCAPQVLGPVHDTLDLIGRWIETEMNGVSDNPLFDRGERLANGGNFYGGYLTHAMDYLKICMANVADLVDRQIMLLISDKTNRGLTPNLADWEGVDKAQRHLYHGLKGVHQNLSAITAEIMAKATPNSIFSRSSESHNQDKVSLGMSAAVQCADQLETMVTVLTCALCCLAQALDLRKIQLKGQASRRYYALVREHIAFVRRDTRLDGSLARLRQALLRDTREQARALC